MNIMERAKEAGNKAKKFFKEHKKEILSFMAGVIVTGGAVAIALLKNSNDEDTETFKISNLDNNNKSIDEDIFTNLAPRIEEVVLCEDIDEWMINKTYKTSFDKYGDPKKGKYGILKNVQVLIRDAGDWDPETDDGDRVIDNIECSKF